MVLGMEAALINLYLKANEDKLDIPDYLKTLNNYLLFVSVPIFILKSVNFIYIFFIYIFIYLFACFFFIFFIYNRLLVLFN
jgi:hypothetical protein